MSDLSKYRDDLTQALHEVSCLSDEAPTGCGLSDAVLASPVLTRIIADARAEVATAIEALHYDAPAAKTAQATAARIARGGAA